MEIKPCTLYTSVLCIVAEKKMCNDVGIENEKFQNENVHIKQRTLFVRQIQCVLLHFVRLVHIFSVVFMTQDSFV